MSADNWTVCPQCSARDPFLGDNEQEYTLREDYELGVTRDGEFAVSYRAHCTGCGWSFNYLHDQQVFTPAGKAALKVERSRRTAIHGEMTDRSHEH